MSISKKRKKKGKNRNTNNSSGKAQRRAQRLSPNDALIKRGKAHIPNAIPVQNELEHKVSELVSELITDYGKGLLDHCETEKELRRVFVVVIMCWNIGMFENREEREKQLQDFMTQLGTNEVEDFVRELIELKLTHYRQYRYLVLDYHIDFNGVNDFKLTVSSVEAPSRK